jgi:hypothetical protein
VLVLALPPDELVDPPPDRDAPLSIATAQPDSNAARDTPASIMARRLASAQGLFARSA